MKHFISPFQKLKEFGLLGMNRRNYAYILERNPRALYPFLDDKLKTKKLLLEHGLPTPELYLKIEYFFEIQKLKSEDLPDSFALKPATGSAGRGIIIIKHKTEQGWQTTSGQILTVEEIRYHLANILAGMFSLGGVTDKAFFEYCIQFHRSLTDISFQGVPDVRVILYRGMPVMSMLRLPTRESDGKANLHQGAVGVGVDMATGLTFGGVLHNRVVSKHPDTHKDIDGVLVPEWNKLLEIAAKIYSVFPLGYIGVDFVVDENLGPLILELNARPGLNIQLANQTGLLPRLNKIDALPFPVETQTPSQKLALFKEKIF